jgi:hypothetical protein
MEHPPELGIIHGHADPAHQLSSVQGGQRSLGEPLRQVLPLDECHTKIVLGVKLTDLEDRHNPRMVEKGKGLDLVMETPDVGLIGKPAGANHLQDHGPVATHIPVLEDDARSATSDLTDDLEVNKIADGGRFGGFLRTHRFVRHR